MSPATGTSKLIPRPLREVLLLEQALQAAEARTPDQAAKIRELAAAVDARVAAAEALAAGDQLAPALVILRDAAHLAAEAVLTTREAGASARAGDSLQRLAELVASGQVADAPEGFTAACELVGSANRLVFDELPPSEAMGRRLQVETAVNWMRGQLEPRSPAQIKVSRALRLVSTGAVLLVTVVGLLVWGATKLISPKNIAYGKAAQLSSRRPNCGTMSPEGLPASGLVDGSKSGTYDVCTNSEVNPWAMVDLGQVFTVSKAKVYNRDDCCWGQYDLPAVFEISVDGKDYTEVARQTTPYTASQPWTVQIGRPARFVRVRVDARDPRELVLTELEVFGH